MLFTRFGSMIAARNDGLNCASQKHQDGRLQAILQLAQSMLPSDAQMAGTESTTMEEVPEASDVCVCMLRRVKRTSADDVMFVLRQPQTLDMVESCDPLLTGFVGLNFELLLNTAVSLNDCNVPPDDPTQAACSTAAASLLCGTRLSGLPVQRDMDSAMAQERGEARVDSSNFGAERFSSWFGQSAACSKWFYAHLVQCGVAERALRHLHRLIASAACRWVQSDDDRQCGKEQLSRWLALHAAVLWNTLAAAEVSSSASDTALQDNAVRAAIKGMGDVLSAVGCLPTKCPDTEGAPSPDGTASPRHDCEDWNSMGEWCRSGEYLFAPCERVNELHAAMWRADVTGVLHGEFARVIQRIILDGHFFGASSILGRCWWGCAADDAGQKQQGCRARRALDVLLRQVLSKSYLERLLPRSNGAAAVTEFIAALLPAVGEDSRCAQNLPEALFAPLPVDAVQFGLTLAGEVLNCGAGLLSWLAGLSERRPLLFASFTDVRIPEFKIRLIQLFLNSGMHFFDANQTVGASSCNNGALGLCVPRRSNNLPSQSDKGSELRLCQLALQPSATGEYHTAFRVKYVRAMLGVLDMAASVTATEGVSGTLSSSPQTVCDSSMCLNHVVDVFRSWMHFLTLLSQGHCGEQQQQQQQQQLALTPATLPVVVSALTVSDVLLLAVEVASNSIKWSLVQQRVVELAGENALTDHFRGLVFSRQLLSWLGGDAKPPMWSIVWGLGKKFASPCLPERVRQAVGPASVAIFHLVAAALVVAQWGPDASRVQDDGVLIYPPELFDNSTLRQIFQAFSPTVLSDATKRRISQISDWAKAAKRSPSLASNPIPCGEMRYFLWLILDDVRSLLLGLRRVVRTDAPPLDEEGDVDSTRRKTYVSFVEAIATACHASAQTGGCVAVNEMHGGAVNATVDLFACLETVPVSADVDLLAQWGQHEHTTSLV